MNFTAFAFGLFCFIILLLLGIIEAVDFITNFAKPRDKIKTVNKLEKQNQPILLATNILGRAVKTKIDNRRNKHESEQPKI